MSRLASAAGRSPWPNSTSSGGRPIPPSTPTPRSRSTPGRRTALDEIVAKELFAEAAKKQGLSAEAYEEAELSKRVAEVTDEEVASFYKANTEQMQGQPF